MDNKIIAYANEKGIVITEEALRLLTEYNYKFVIDELSKKNIIFIKKDDIEKVLIKEKIYEKDNSNHFQILTQYDVTNQNLSKGKVEDFHKLFIDKYEVLSKIIKERVDFTYITIEEALKQRKNCEVHIIGMVSEKYITKSNNLKLIVEDLTGQVNIIIINKDEKQLNENKKIMLDNVIGFKCAVLSQNTFICNEIIYPDIPYVNRQPLLKQDKYLVVISDIHVGSKLFLEKEFLRFIDWLNFKNEEDEEIVKNIKYLVIGGDLVDGIGIYPSQYDELAIYDIFEQYKLFEEYVLKMPKNIEIFIIPGNHDAVRLSDPQPAIPVTYLPKLYEEKNIHMLSSPAWVMIEGYNCLMYHGASLHGIYKEFKEITFETPDLAIKEVIKKRDLMPQYGDKQTFIPISKNFLVMKEIPDIYIGGDIHHHAYSTYKNCHIINGSCWQSMTKFQKEKKFVPTVAKVLIFNLRTQKLIIKDFLYENTE